MPTSNHKLQTSERDHWSRAQVAVLNRFNWPAKGKANPKLAVRLASQIADMAMDEYRARIPRRNGSRK